MKNIKLIIGILFVALTAASCEDYLEEDIKSNVAAEDYYLTADGFTSLVNANYSQLRNIYGDEPWLFCAGTDLYAQGRQAEPTGLSQYTDLNSTSESVGFLYEQCYKAIQTANQGLFYSEITEQTSQLSTQIGELKYLRANAYFLLVQTYGGVPLVTENITEPVLQFERSSAEEIYSFIISELQQAADMVGNGAYNGHVTLRSTKHLMALVYLTRAYESFGSSADFQTAATLADEAIGGQGLSIPYGDLFAPGNDLNNEVLFSVQYSAGSVTADPTNLGNTQGSYFGSYLGGPEITGDAPFKTYNLCPTLFAVSLFEEGDARWEGTFMTEIFERYYDFYDVADTSELEVTHYYAPKWASTQADLDAYAATHPNTIIYPYGFYVPSANRNFDFENIVIRKFDDPTAPYGGADSKPSKRDIILSRLGETYLIAAEAYLGAGNAATGLDRLNVVRNRSNAVPASIGDFDIDYLLDERARELMGEYHRWFDLKRTGKLVERASAYHYLINQGNFNGANGELKILRPIPQNAIDLNQNENFRQNPAYQ